MFVDVCDKNNLWRDRRREREKGDDGGKVEEGFVYIGGLERKTMSKHVEGTGSSK